MPPVAHLLHVHRVGTDRTGPTAKLRQSTFQSQQSKPVTTEQRMTNTLSLKAKKRRIELPAGDFQFFPLCSLSRGIGQHQTSDVTTSALRPPLSAAVVFVDAVVVWYCGGTIGGQPRHCGVPPGSSRRASLSRSARRSFKS